MRRPKSSQVRVLMEAAETGPFSAFPTRCFLEVYRKANPFQQTNKNQQNQNRRPHVLEIVTKTGPTNRLKQSLRRLVREGRILLALVIRQKVNDLAS